MPIEHTEDNNNTESKIYKDKEKKDFIKEVTDDFEKNDKRGIRDDQEIYESGQRILNKCIEDIKNAEELQLQNGTLKNMRVKNKEIRGNTVIETKNFYMQDAIASLQESKKHFKERRNKVVEEHNRFGLGCRITTTEENKQLINEIANVINDAEDKALAAIRLKCNPMQDAKNAVLESSIKTDENGNYIINNGEIMTQQPMYNMEKDGTLTFTDRCNSLSPKDAFQGLFKGKEMYYIDYTNCTKASIREKIKKLTGETRLILTKDPISGDFIMRNHNGETRKNETIIYAGVTLKKDESLWQNYQLRFTNNDKIPDLNIDTDGDEIPELNIDINGDNKPDINIDTDNDYHPDINIDVDNDGRPDVNIDVNNDGISGLNIDINGDAIPDLNIDINGDNKPDINIDVDNDGSSDFNIDIDNDGRPDVNIIPTGTFSRLKNNEAVIKNIRKTRRIGEDDAQEMLNGMIDAIDNPHGQIKHNHAEIKNSSPETKQFIQLLTQVQNLEKGEYLDQEGNNIKISLNGSVYHNDSHQIMIAKSKPQEDSNSRTSNIILTYNIKEQKFYLDEFADFSDNMSIDQPIKGQELKNILNYFEHTIQDCKKATNSNNTNK